MSADTITFIVTLLALAGVVVGVFISQIPTEFASKRDEHQNIANIWNVVRFDLLRIEKFCLHESKNIDERVKAGLVVDAGLGGAILQPVKIGRIVATAWEIVASSGDFITTTNAYEIGKLGKIYANIKMANEEIDRYIAFISHYGIISSSATTVVSIIEQHYKDIQNLYTEIAKDIQNIENKMNREINLHKSRGLTWQIALIILEAVGFAAFIFLVVLCIWFIKHAQ